MGRILIYYYGTASALGGSFTDTARGCLEYYINKLPRDKIPDATLVINCQIHLSKLLAETGENTAQQLQCVTYVFFVSPVFTIFQLH